MLAVACDGGSSDGNNGNGASTTDGDGASSGSATCAGDSNSGGGATSGTSNGATTGSNATVDPALCSEIIRPRANPVEFVGLTVSQLITPEELIAFLGAIYGDEARAGQRHHNLALQSGLLLTVREDPASAEQVIVELDMEVARPNIETRRRTILRVPASYAYGAVFMDTVEVAIERAMAV
ncbi:MAG: hypothetical protein AAFX99_25305, partial [Myxococcota bacterium]